MSADDRFEDLLDDWEELAERNPQADLDAFLQEHTLELDEESLARFRQRAAALARMNQRLDALQETNSRPGDTSEPGNAISFLADLKPGYEPLEGYKIVERLGRGGFGEVWKATDAEGFSVAIKFVPLRSTFGDKELRSLEVIKDVRHPHLLSIVRVARRGDVLVIAMELAERSLADRFEEARKEGYDGIPRQELLEYMAEAAKGIDFLNDAGSFGRPGIQHRDIKPANLLLSGSSVKIADYSLAQALKFNVAESVGSTPAYAAPEFFGGNTSSQSDQYSLAVTYCLLRGGRLPYEGSLYEVMEGHRNREPDLSRLPANERRIVARALAKKPKDRWESCSEFVRELGSAQVAPSESPATNPAPSPTNIGRGTKVAFAVILLALVIPLGLRYLLFPEGSSTRRANSPVADEITDNGENVYTMPAAGRDLSEKLNEKNAKLAVSQQRLADLLENFPLNVMNYQMIGEVQSSGEGIVNTTLRCSLNTEKYRVLLKDIREFVNGKSIYSGVANFPLEDDGTRLNYAAELDERAIEYLNGILASERNNDPSHCFLIVGNSITPNRDRDDERKLVADYYVLDRRLGDIIRAAWRRASELSVRCELVDEDEQAIVTLIEKPALYTSSYPNKVARLPITPVGGAWGTSLLDIDADYDRYNYPNIIVCLPTLLAPTEAGRWAKLGILDTPHADVSIRFSVAPGDVSRIRKVRVNATLPRKP